MRDRMRELLMKSLDAELTPGERGELESALAGSAGLRRERGELLAVRELLRKGAPRGFSPFFAERVMQGVRTRREAEASGARFLESLRYAFTRVAVVAAAVAVFLLAYNVNRVGSLSVAAAFGAAASQTQEIEDVLAAPVEEVLEVLL